MPRLLQRQALPFAVSCTALPETQRIPGEGMFALTNTQRIPSEDVFALTDTQRIPIEGYFALTDARRIPGEGSFALPETQRIPGEGGSLQLPSLHWRGALVGLINIDLGQCQIALKHFHRGMSENCLKRVRVAPVA